MPDVDGAHELPLPRADVTIDPDQELVPPFEGEKEPKQCECGQ